MQEVQFLFIQVLLRLFLFLSQLVISSCFYYAHLECLIFEKKIKMFIYFTIHKSNLNIKLFFFFQKLIAFIG